MTRRSQLAGVAVVVCCISCRPSKPNVQERADAPAVITVSPAASATSPSSTATRLARVKDIPIELTFVLDGTLTAYGSQSVLSWTPDGTVKRRSVVRPSRIHATREHRGVVLEDEGEDANHATLLATPSLTPVYDGPGKPTDYGTAVWIAAKREILVALDGEKIATIPLPATVATDSLPVVDSALTGSRINVTWSDSSGQGERALLWDVTKNAALPHGVVNARRFGDGQSSIIAGAYGYQIAERVLSRVDLRTGTATRSTIACANKDGVFNPTPSPNHDMLLVTCDMDGVVLDGKTLKPLRRIPAIMPGCDNGMNLGGEILSDQHTLSLSGCGGEARVDLATGAHVCSDEPGLSGAPYDMGLAAGHGRRAAPYGRDRLKPCSPNDRSFATWLGANRRYQVVPAEHQVVKTPNGDLTLEEDASAPILSADENLMAYLRGDTIVVRMLPSGAVKAELRLAEP